jgi:hypothetical protein
MVASVRMEYSNFVALIWAVLPRVIRNNNYFTRGKYGVRDAIIIWCAVIAMVTGWPIGYFFGSIMYHAR